MQRIKSSTSLPDQPRAMSSGWGWFAIAPVSAFVVGCMTYRVDTFADVPDANIGDRICARAVEPGSRTSAPGGLCSLRAALAESNASIWRTDTVELPAGLYHLDLPVAAGGGRLIVTDRVRIQGQGAGDTVIEGNATDSVIQVQSAGLELNHVTVRGGHQSAGGGVRVDGGTSEFVEVVVRDNQATLGGGGIAVAAGATLRLRRSTVRDNVVFGAFGGGIWNEGELWVYDSTVSGNVSTRRGGIFNIGEMNLRNVTVSGNAVNGDSVGVGGIAQQGFAVLNNVTVTNNTGLNNESPRGGGIQTIPGATTVMKNSIVAGNDGAGGPNDCDGTLSADSKYNLIGDSNGCTIPAFVSTFLLDVDPLLGVLTNSGGPTLTHRPGAGSPALEAGYMFAPPATDACEPRDQRGVPRPQGAARCDMGAVEAGNASAFVSGFMLVDAATDGDIRPLRHGDALVLSALPAQLSVRAVFSGVSPGSVVFDYDNTAAIQTENASPYALAGDNAGDFNPFGFAVGTHTLTATPFAAAAGAGAAGGALSIRFDVRN